MACRATCRGNTLRGGPRRARPTLCSPPHTPHARAQHMRTARAPAPALLDGHHGQGATGGAKSRPPCLAGASWKGGVRTPCGRTRTLERMGRSGTQHSDGGASYVVGGAQGSMGLHSWSLRWVPVLRLVVCPNAIAGDVRRAMRHHGQEVCGRELCGMRRRSAAQHTQDIGWRT